VYFDLVANHGWSCYKVSQDLNALGIPTRFKKLGRVLKSINIIKYIKINGQVVALEALLKMISLIKMNIFMVRIASLIL